MHPLPTAPPLDTCRATVRATASLAPRRALRHAHRGFTLVELMVVVAIIAILASLAIPSMIGGNQDLKTFQSAQHIAELVQTGRSRALATGSAHVVVFSTNAVGAVGNLPGKVVVQAGERTIGTTPRVPVNSCKVAGTFGFNISLPAPVSTVVAPFTSPVIDMMIYGNQRRLIDEGIQMVSMRDAPAAAGVTSDMWVCFTPTGRGFVAATPGGLAAGPPLLAPVLVDIARVEGGVRQGLTRSVVIIPGSAPRIFSSQIP